MKQREIKFRAWHESEKVMYEVAGMNFELGLVELRDPDKEDDFGKVVLMKFAGLTDENDVELMQFTGMTDKNGVEIYEGDYLVDPYKEDGKWEESLLEVQWCHKTLQWAIDASYKQDRGFLINLVDYFTFDELEVRGNIFENPKNE